MKMSLFLISLLLLPLSAAPPAPGADGWIPLFDGSTTQGFTDASGKPSRWKVEDGALRGDDKWGDIWTKEEFGDFILELEFKTTGNSGVFIRTSDPQDPVQTGIEVQVDKPGGPGKHSVGALYDLVAPRSNAAKDGEWNRYVITAKGPEISVVLNGEAVSSMNLDQWTTAGKNPDGSLNKFQRPLQKFSRRGRIGFQDHGHAVWYRGIRLKPLP